MSVQECLCHPWLNGTIGVSTCVPPTSTNVTQYQLCLTCCTKCGSTGSCHHDITSSPVVEITHDRGIIC